jgi:hypothetical protein
MSLRLVGFITHMSSDVTVFVVAHSYTLDNDAGHRWVFDLVNVGIAPCVPFQLFSFQSFKSTSPLISLTPGEIPLPTLKSCAPVLVRSNENRYLESTCL